MVDAGGGEACDEGHDCEGDLACVMCACTAAGSSTTVPTTSSTSSSLHASTSSTTSTTVSTLTTSVSITLTTTSTSSSSSSVPTTSSTSTTSSTTSSSSTLPGTPPPDPSTVAPPPDAGVATDFAAATAFLYTTSGIQTGVVPGTIDPRRVVVLRGRILERDGTALPGVRVTVHAHPELGQTLSRTDGRFDLAANGGGTVTVEFAKDGFLPVQRGVDVPWRDWWPSPTWPPFPRTAQSRPSTWACRTRTWPAAAWSATPTAHARRRSSSRRAPPPPRCCRAARPSRWRCSTCARPSTRSGKRARRNAGGAAFGERVHLRCRAHRRRGGPGRRRERALRSAAPVLRRSAGGLSGRDTGAGRLLRPHPRPLDRVGERPRRDRRERRRWRRGARHRRRRPRRRPGDARRSRRHGRRAAAPRHPVRARAASLADAGSALHRLGLQLRVQPPRRRHRPGWRWRRRGRMPELPEPQAEERRRRPARLPLQAGRVDHRLPCPGAARGASSRRPAVRTALRERPRPGARDRRYRRHRAERRRPAGERARDSPEGRGRRPDVRAAVPPHQEPEDDLQLGSPGRVRPPAHGASAGHRQHRVRVCAAVHGERRSREESHAGGNVRSVGRDRQRRRRWRRGRWCGRHPST